MRTRLYLLFLGMLLIGFQGVRAQDGRYVEGVVVDSLNGEPLAFVNVTYGEPARGTTTDIDGYFKLEVPAGVDRLHLSYVGYGDKDMALRRFGRGDTLRISMSQESYNLEGVVVKPGKNPANRIIQKAYRNRDSNDPENLEAYSYRSYNKFIFTADSVPREQPATASRPNDSSVIRLKKLTRRQHLMLMESVTKRQYMKPDRTSEKVLASRLSGFKDPSLAFLATQFQSFSFYDDFIKLGDDRYLNPISKNSWRKYFFHLEDTLYSSLQDTVFVLSYRPRRGKLFPGLHGVLQINTNGYALQNVIAEPWDPPSDLSVKIQQKYELIDGRQWFPYQLNTRLKFKNVLLASGQDDYYLMGEGRTYIYDRQLNPKLDPDDFGHVELSVPRRAYQRSPEFWQRYRRSGLTGKDRRTYRIIDSLGRAHHFDRMLYTFQSLSTGYLPLGPLDISLTQMLDYNQYEGFRVGLGLKTNEQVSEVFALGGYMGYGFDDQQIKYGAHLDLNLHRSSEMKLSLSYRDDVVETGGYRFLREISLFSSEMYRDFMIKSMDRVQRWQLGLSFRTLEYLKAKPFLRISRVTPFGDYTLQLPDENHSGTFHVTEAGLRLRYAYGEDFVQTHRGKYSLGTDAPVFYANITRGIEQLGGQHPYTRFEGAVSKKLETRSLGTTHIRLEGGYSHGEVPLFNLYRGQGSFSSRFSLYSRNSFATMGLDEFVSDRFISVFWTHNFHSLLWRNDFSNPQVQWVNHLGWGWLDHPQRHQGLSPKAYEQGYFETGIVLDRLLSTGLFHYGLGVFYRYGPYAYEQFSDNLAYKFSLRFAFE